MGLAYSLGPLASERDRPVSDRRKFLASLTLPRAAHSTRQAHPGRSWRGPYPNGVIGSGVRAWSYNDVPLLTDLDNFLCDHRAHGTLTADATEPAWNGYLLTVACPCGVVFERWVTPEEADADLLRLASLN